MIFCSFQILCACQNEVWFPVNASGLNVRYVHNYKKTHLHFIQDRRLERLHSFQIISNLQRQGPMALIEPRDLYTLCLSAGLLPRNMDLTVGGVGAVSGLFQ